ncbi:MAG TPA: hypothetical protein VK530_21710 [Candidatus Acidoferrum sp.]|nr:hypothetical protein [Candidatus Acidoferrum sp.]
MKSTWILLAALSLLVGCNKDKGVPGRDDRVQTGGGTPGATPNQALTGTNSSQRNSVPREGGNLDRGATRDNDPVRNAPGPDGTALDQKASGTGSATK